LWEKFLASIEGNYENASHALRELMKQHIKANKSLETEQPISSIHQGKTLFLKSPFKAGRLENKEEAKG